MILAMIRLRSVNLQRLAQEPNPDAQQDSNDCRIQMFFRLVPFTHVKPARWMVDQFRQEGQTVKLYLDRTNRKYGQKDINFLIFAVQYRGCALPLLWQCLEHPGNSSTRLRVHMVHRVKRLFRPMCKLTLLWTESFLSMTGSNI